ncbi:hypothetical protein COY25_04700 [Candidatus Uhrbacteria bacterium CG_4_10_14_0_2_um_filter_41_7]|uniref:DUF3307 domain-containing protein n=1 Tax=Candidatus Uhrbacteria bacterium CG_4_9_14_3_um_filter_41_35 TaxID=1975034 RepID=A0A2M7XG12_9BACT|nr:MAG: hypothetical protein COV92_03895 [Candidatus Uhrbacteria bacterium CG11_big_fil_rev_8_21_14_0_20_41_9]PIZ52674.1 MAG: hypothetical protein COY25_04700 [Candidatus Uhrbacteria bacterium CG_4_10_14_0_2_um_filter_41_7]PJA46813.1 MAG: hypothetical protein CO173_01155 [Candidatus Uhrbacteria bacterium CG_4_9_14_3_um_filter_41_35]
MTLSTHTAIGAIIGFSFGNPIVGFILGFISHFLVDMIPHGDSEIADQYKVQKVNVKKILAYMMIDAVTAIILIVTLFETRSADNTAVLGASIAGSVLPDLLVGIYEVTKSKYLLWFNRLHFFFHDYFIIKYHDIKLPYSLLGQFIFIFLVFKTI